MNVSTEGPQEEDLLAVYIDWSDAQFRALGCDRREVARARDRSGGGGAGHDAAGQHAAIVLRRGDSRKGRSQLRREVQPELRRHLRRPVDDDGAIVPERERDFERCDARRTTTAPYPRSRRSPPPSLDSHLTDYSIRHILYAEAMVPECRECLELEM